MLFFSNLNQIDFFQVYTILYLKHSGTARFNDFTCLKLLWQGVAKDLICKIIETGKMEVFPQLHD